MEIFYSQIKKKQDSSLQFVWAQHHEGWKKCTAPQVQLRIWKSFMWQFLLANSLKDTKQQEAVGTAVAPWSCWFLTVVAAALRDRHTRFIFFRWSTVIFSLLIFFYSVDIYCHSFCILILNIWLNTSRLLLLPDWMWSCYEFLWTKIDF